MGCHDDEDYTSPGWSDDGHRHMTQHTSLVKVRQASPTR